MSTKTRLYDAFGEMLYVVAMADGIIQAEEKETLSKLVKLHPYGNEMQWSFDYETAHESNIEDVYQKVLNICQENGPDPEYQMLIEVMEEVAKASSGIDENEQQVIDRFINELTTRFKNDVNQL